MDTCTFTTHPTFCLPTSREQREGTSLCPVYYLSHISSRFTSMLDPNRDVTETRKDGTEFLACSSLRIPVPSFVLEASSARPPLPCHRWNALILGSLWVSLNPKSSGVPCISVLVGHWRARVGCIAHIFCVYAPAPLSHDTSLTKHKFYNRIAKNFEVGTAEPKQAWGCISQGLPEKQNQ